MLARNKFINWVVGSGCRFSFAYSTFLCLCANACTKLFIYFRDYGILFICIFSTPATSSSAPLSYYTIRLKWLYDFHWCIAKLVMIFKLNQEIIIISVGGSDWCTDNNNFLKTTSNGRRHFTIERKRGDEFASFSFYRRVCAPGRFLLYSIEAQPRISRIHRTE